MSEFVYKVTIWQDSFTVRATTETEAFSEAVMTVVEDSSNFKLERLGEVCGNCRGYGDVVIGAHEGGAASECADCGGTGYLEGATS